jgi:hypothetical protein
MIQGNLQKEVITSLGRQGDCPTTAAEEASREVIA